MWVVDLICLRQQDHWRNFGVVGQRQVAFQTGHVEIGIAGGGDKQRVDVRGNQLPFAVRIVRPALQRRCAVQTAYHTRRVLIAEHPVAYGNLRCRHARIQSQIANTVDSQRRDLGAMHAAYTCGNSCGYFVHFQLRLEVC